MNFWFLAFTLIFQALADQQSLGNKDPYQLSLEGIHRQEIIYDRQEPQIQDTEVSHDISIPQLQKKIKVLVNVTSIDKPLFVLVPGLYGSLDSPEHFRFGQMIVKQGYNVLRVPNPISTAFLEAVPKYLGMDYHSEANAIAEIVREIQRIYKFRQVHFIGTSYGAFVSAVTVTQLQNAYQSRLFLVSPPKNLLKSLKVIDREFDQLLAIYERIPWQQLWFLVDLYWSRFLGREISVEPQMAKETIIVYGFYRTFLQLTEIQERYHHPRPWWGWFAKWESKLDQKKTDLRFLNYLKNTNPQFFKNPAQHDLFYWVEQITSQWTIVTTNDDFINPSVEWPKSPSVHVYQKGGHIFGYLDQKQFEDELNSFIKSN